MLIAAQHMHVDAPVQIGLQAHFAPRGRYWRKTGAQRMSEAAAIAPEPAVVD